MKAKQLCALCGEREATTGKGDHLPPKNLYPPQWNQNVRLNTVPACRPCNGGGSRDDEEFKLIIGLTTGEFRVEQELLINSLARTMDGNKKLARRILQSSQHIYARSPGGVLHPRVAMKFDRGAYARVVERIVKGLYWMETGNAMKDKKVFVVHGDEVNGRAVNDVKALLARTNPVSLNGGTFTYKVLLNEEGTSFWGLQFFKKHTVFAFVDPIPAPATHTAGSAPPPPPAIR